MCIRDRAYKGTMAYGILTAHNTSGNDRDLRIKFDAMASHDITFVAVSYTHLLSAFMPGCVPGWKRWKAWTDVKHLHC